MQIEPGLHPRISEGPTSPGRLPAPRFSPAGRPPGYFFCNLEGCLGVLHSVGG